MVRDQLSSTCMTVSRWLLLGHIPGHLESVTFRVGGLTKEVTFQMALDV